VAPVDDQLSAVADGPAGGAGAAPRRRRRGGPLVTQQDVVDAAMALLDAGGWEALSMRAVCRHLDVSLPTVYAVARSREAVVELVGAEGLATWAAAWRAPADADAGPAADAAVLDAATAAMADRPWLFDLVRLQPSTARAAIAHLPGATVRQLAALAPSTASFTWSTSPSAHPAPGDPAVDRVLLVWMVLELAHRLGTAGLSGAPTGAVGASVLAAVLGTVG